MKVEGDERQAVSFLMVALSHPTCRRQTKDRAVSFSMALQSHFPAEEVEGARQWAKTTRIEDVVSAWLSAHGKVLKKKGSTRKKAVKVRKARKIAKKKAKKRK
jgi:hypothetical protein